MPFLLCNDCGLNVTTFTQGKGKPGKGLLLALDFLDTTFNFEFFSML